MPGYRKNRKRFYSRQPTAPMPNLVVLPQMMGMYHPSPVYMITSAEYLYLQQAAMGLFSQQVAAWNMGLAPMYHQTLPTIMASTPLAPTQTLTHQPFPNETVTQPDQISSDNTIPVASTSSGSIPNNNEREPSIGEAENRGDDDGNPLDTNAMQSCGSEDEIGIYIACSHGPILCH